jgi:hypothetical protein
MVRVFFLIFILGMVNPALDAQAQISNRTRARQQIMGLHDGVLLVRLQTRSKSLETIRERGMDKKADQIEAELKEENEEIMRAFEAEYDFSPVYFFNSEDSEALRRGDYDEVTFFDFNRDSVDLDLGKTYFLTAEFGNVQADTGKVKGDYIYTKDETGVKQEKTYTSAPDPGFGALIIMSDQFIQLADPFPSYVRTFETLFFLRRDPREVVRRMNDKLHAFY